MSEPVLECTNPWETACLCGARHMPCWPRPDTSCCDRLEPADPTPEQTAQIERMLHVATEIIWRLSGKQFGSCPVTVRPCRQTCSGGTAYGYWSGSTWTPVLDGGRWYNERCGKCAPSGCSCTELCEVVLPGPIAEVLQVKVGGLVLDPTEYRVDDRRKLVRTNVMVSEGGALGCWPTCQDLSAADTEPGTMSVRYRPGNAVPQGGLWAAGRLACQLLAACSPEGECVLPANAQRIARQGVTVELTPVLIDREHGGFNTGLPDVDLWLESVNPYRSKMPSRVFSIDRPAPRTQTWPCD